MANHMLLVLFVLSLKAPMPVTAAAPPKPVTPTLNVAKLTDFTTHFSFDATSLLKGGEGGADPSLMLLGSMGVKAEGSLSLDAVGKKMALDVHITSSQKGADHVKIVFDGADGWAALATSEKVIVPKMILQPSAVPISASACIKVSVPPAMFPPSPVIANKIKAMSPMASMVFSMTPHASLSYKGEDLLLFAACVGVCAHQYPPAEPGHGDAGIATTDEGIPVDIFPSSTIGSADQLAANIMSHHAVPIASFSSWTAGAGALPDVSCHQGATTELLTEDPHVTASLSIAEHVLMSVDAMPFHSLQKSMFTQVPQLLRASVTPATTAATETVAPGSDGPGYSFGVVVAAALVSALSGVLITQFARGRYVNGPASLLG